MKGLISIAIGLAVVSAAGHGDRSTVIAAQTNAADAIYVGGHILTMNEAQPVAEAVAVKDGKILAVGERATIEARNRGPGTRVVDLDGRTMTPGFIDAHSHLSQVGLQALGANLRPPPDGTAASIADIQTILRDYIAQSPFAKEHDLAIGFNYDDTQLTERRAPTREELDAVSDAVPIIVIDQSGHTGVYNSKALEQAGITAATTSPGGGVIQRSTDGKTPSGVLEDAAHVAALSRLIPRFTTEQGLELIAAGQDVYLANGFTTIQDGRTDPAALTLLAAAAKAGTFVADVVAYPDLPLNVKNPMLTGPLMARTYTDHFRIGGIKLAFDGWPQDRTAWFTEPYHEQVAGQEADYRGSALFARPGEAQRWIDLAYKNEWQALVHANGDAAIDQLIETVTSAQKTSPATDRRTVLVHGQSLRPDQVEPLEALGILPSVCPLQIFYWGDDHRASVAGPERAAFLSPTGALLEKDVTFTIHSDAPGAWLDSMRILDAAVNRATRTGQVLGPEQRMSPEAALKAMTAWAAYQYFEEASKGSIEVGKLADFVILDQDPSQVAPEAIREITVLETIKEGRTIFEATP